MIKKNLVMGISALFSLAPVVAQDMNAKEIPTEIVTAFEASYPEVDDIEWEKNDSIYNVDFEMKGQEHEIWYTAEGKVSQSEREISESDLPEVIASALTANYAGYKVDSVEIMEENGSTLYEIELEKSGLEDKNVTYDNEGKLVSEIND